MYDKIGHYTASWPCGVANMRLGFTKKDQTLSALWAEQQQRFPVA
jgi:hypothetical protein